MAHYIAMSGSYGCMPDWRCCCESESDAVDAIVDMFCDVLTDESEPEFRAQLVDNGIVGLHGTDAGADYAEIVECDCDDASQHEEY